MAWFLVLLGSFFTPDTPDPEDPTPQIVSELADDRAGLAAGAYLTGFASFLFIVFTAGLATRLRAAEPERGPSLLVALGGLGTSVLLIASSGVTLAMVETADEGREPAAVRALLELDNVFFIGIGFTLAALYVGAAASVLANQSLPRWLAWVAAALAAVFVVCLLGVLSEDEDGGVLGTIFFFALLVNFLWILCTSIVMVRGARAGAAPLGPPD
jgi:hypothetical protein